MSHVFTIESRDADILAVDSGVFWCVIEAQAPLTALPGYGKALSALTEGIGRHRMILSHYAPVPPDPGGAAA